MGPETLLGKALILASPFTTVLVDYALSQARASLDRWESARPLRRARRTLQKGIKDPHIPDERRQVYRAQLADLRDAEVAQQLAGVTMGSAVVLTEELSERT